MIELLIKNVRVCFHFSFFAAVSLVFLCGDSRAAEYSLYACLLHEAGHLAVMFISGQPVKKLVFYGAGIKIVRAAGEGPGSALKELAAVSSGCAVNFLIYAFSLLSDGNMRAFGVINLVTGLFNIMPFSFLDGGKLIVLLFYSVFPFDTASRLERYLKGANIVTVPAAAIFFFIAGLRNFTVYVTLVFLLFMSFMV